MGLMVRPYSGKKYAITGLVMKTLEDHQWLSQFQLVKVTRRLEEDIKQHRREMTRVGIETDWDRALVDWTVVAAHEQVEKELEMLSV